MAVQRAASRRGSEGRSLLGSSDRVHLQRHVRRRAAGGRALHRRAGQRLLLVPVADSRRPHEPLRPRHAAVRRLRLQAAIARRAWLRLADRLRGPGPVLRQGGTIHRCRRHRRKHPQRARRDFRQAGGAPRARHARPTLVREAQYPRRPGAAGGDDLGEKRPARLSLLRPVRPRLHDGVQLRLELRADLPGDQDRPRAGPRQRHGARAHHRCDRQGHRGLVHRQDRRDRETSALPHGRPGGERVRIVAAAPQLEVVATSAGARELVRHGRPISDGHRRLEHVGVGARAIGDAALQLRRLRLAPLRAMVGLGQTSGARISRAATTSKSAAGTGCRGLARSPAS